MTLVSKQAAAPNVNYNTLRELVIQGQVHWVQTQVHSCENKAKELQLLDKTFQNLRAQSDIQQHTAVLQHTLNVSVMREDDRLLWAYGQHTGLGKQDHNVWECPPNVLFEVIHPTTERAACGLKTTELHC